MDLERDDDDDELAWIDGRGASTTWGGGGGGRRRRRNKPEERERKRDLKMQRPKGDKKWGTEDVSSELWGGEISRTNQLSNREWNRLSDENQVLFFRLKLGLPIGNEDKVILHDLTYE